MFEWAGLREGADNIGNAVYNLGSGIYQIGLTGVDGSAALTNWADEQQKQFSGVDLFQFQAVSHLGRGLQSGRIGTEDLLNAAPGMVADMVTFGAYSNIQDDRAGKIDFSQMMSNIGVEVAFEALTLKLGSLFRFVDEIGDVGNATNRLDDIADVARRGIDDIGGVNRVDDIVEELRTKCFTRDTLVSTAHGHRPIGEIQAGDRVWSFDFAADQWRLQSVIDRIDSLYSGPIVTIEAGGEQIETTIHHPFWVVDGHELSLRSVPRTLSVGEDEGHELPGRWVNSHELQAGDTITTKSGERYRVTAISQRFAIDHPVSNLSVQQHRNYTVGRHSVLVHNESICEAGEAAIRDMLDEGDFELDEIMHAVRTGGFDNADDVLRRLLDDIQTQAHHPYPKYLGGAEKQDLIDMPVGLHKEYHRGLDAIANRRLGKTFFDNMPAGEKADLLAKVAEYTKRFDAQHGTTLYQSMLKEGFPGAK